MESYTMLTINADAPHLMSRIHKPDPKLAADQLDKRSVVAIVLEDTHWWLESTLAEASSLLMAPDVDLIEATR